MTTLSIEEIHPQLRSLVQQFLLKCKYPYQVYGTGRWVYDNETKYCIAVGFFDPNAKMMNAAGTLKWQHGDFGKPHKYRVITRTVLNSRYKDRERQMSIDTQDGKRALKEMLTHIKPFTLQEMASNHSNHVHVAINRWRVEANRDLETYTDRLDCATIMEEIRNLKAQGVTFTTEAFRDTAEKGIATFEEYLARQKAKFNKHFVKFNDNGTIDVLSPHGHSQFTAFEALPTRIQEVVGMLKLMGYKEGDHFPEVLGMGVQVGVDSYWVLDPVEHTGA